MSDDEDKGSRNWSDGVWARATGVERLDLKGDLSYEAGKGQPAPISKPSGPTSPFAAFIMLALLALGVICWLGESAFDYAHAAALKDCVSSVERLRPLVVDYKESDLDRILVYHPFSTYAAYAPGYEHYIGVITQESIWSDAGGRTDYKIRERRAVIEAARQHGGDNSPEYIALTAAGWKLCLEARCSLSQEGLGLQYLNWLASAKQVPEAQFDEVIYTSSWNKGTTQLSNSEILWLAPIWRTAAEQHPKNPLITEVAQRLDPKQHGLNGYIYLRALQFQKEQLGNYDVESTTRR